MWVLYLLVNNFGWAVILFTFVVKAASFPLNLKQSRNMAVSQLFTPRVQEIQRKYKGNQAKLQEEMSKLQKEGYNPMGGCGPMFLIFILLFGIIDVVYKPMTHLEHFDWTEQGSIAIVKNIGKQTEFTSIILGSDEDSVLLLDMKEDSNLTNVNEAEGRTAVTHPTEWVLTPKAGITYEERLEYGEYIANNFEIVTGENSRISGTVKNELRNANNKYLALQGELYTVQTFANSPDAFKNINPEIFAKLEKLKENMNFFGIDLGRVPTLAPDIIILIPILSFIFSLAQMIISQIIQKKSMPGVPQQGGMGMKAMLYITPIISLTITFAVPAGAGFYWGVSYIFGILQSLVTYKFWPPERLREEMSQKMKEKTSVYNTTATVTDVDRDGNTVVREERLSELSGKEQKEYYRKKLEEARRADQEKYGDPPDDNAEVVNIEKETFTETENESE